MTMDQIVHKGWLTKSPPERKTHGAWRFFKAKWRRRYFVLYNPPAAESLPGAKACLAYYDSDSLKRQLGRIDLDHCQEVVSKLDSSYYQHVFSLETRDRGKPRNYYLVADSADDMTKWVDCLCWILNLKDAVEEVQMAPSRDDLEPERRSLQEASPSVQPAVPPLSATTLPRPAGHTQSTMGPEDKTEAYIHLWTCGDSPPREPLSRGASTSSTSHLKSPLNLVPPPPNSNNRRRDSIPDEIPPPPPMKLQGHSVSQPTGPVQEGNYDKPPTSYVNLDDNDNNNIYKVPTNNDFHKVPPVKHTEFIDPDGVYNVPPPRPEPYGANDTYDVPPKHAVEPDYRSHRASNSSEGSHSSHPMDSGWESSQSCGTYDTPPSRYDISDGNMVDQFRTSLGIAPSVDDTYDVPPLRKDNILEQVPSPPRGKVSGQSYMNLPPNDPKGVMEDVYDVPPLHGKLQGELVMKPPPPPQPCTTKIHVYKNAPGKPVNYPFDTGVSSPSACEGVFESTYLPMVGGGVGPDYPSEEVYLPMNSLPRDSRHSQSSGIYSNTDKWSGVAGSRDSDIYSARPSNRPVNLPSQSTAPHLMMTNPNVVAPQPKLPAGYSPQQATDADKAGMHYLALSNRSQSFRRKIDVSSQKPLQTVPLPTRLEGHDATSSSDEEEDESDSVSSHDQSLESLTSLPRKHDQYLPPKNSLNSTPPPPKRPGQVEYLALDLDQPVSNEVPDRSPVFPRSPPLPERHSSPTHYREIDFVKTKALEEMKNDLEKQRKSSEKSVDE